MTVSIPVRRTLDAIPDENSGVLPDLINLATNEMRQPPPAAVVAAIEKAAAAVNEYPQLASPDLTAALARFHQIDPLNVVVSNGSANLLLQLMVAICDYDGEHRPEIVFASPGFEAYATLPRVAGAKAIPVPLSGYQQDLGALHAAIDRDRTRMVVLCNPHNPTGTVLDAEEITRFLDRVPGHVLVVLDEAYRDFADDRHTPTGMSLFRRGEWDNLAVIHSMSKGFALGGARIGYGVAHPLVAAGARKCGVPFSVNRFAQAAGIAALEHAAEFAGMRDLVRHERQRVREELLGLGFAVPESHTNFLWLPLGSDTIRFHGHCLGRNFIVKSYPPPDRGIRVTIGTPEENRAFVAAVRTFRLDRTDHQAALSGGSREDL